MTVYVETGRMCLCIHYTNMEFLIERSRFSAQLALDCERSIRSPIRYLSSVTKFRDRILPVFDFDAYLRQTFRSESDSSSGRLLISHLSCFSEPGRKAIKTINIKSRNDTSKLEYIGIKVPGDSQILEVPASELKLISPVVPEIREARGIIGVRVLADRRIQYLIDSETIIVNAIAHCDNTLE
jgi:chemotaxis signal transduction protein